MAVYFSSFALRLLAGASTLQVLALQGLNPTVSKPTEPSVGCCPAKQSPGSLRPRKGARKRASEETGTRALEIRERELPGRGNPQEPEKKVRERKREREEERKKETRSRALKPSASKRALGQAELLQLEVIVRAGVCVVRTTARPAPAEGGGGLGEWVTSRGRRQAVWAAEPMNQLSGEGERRAGGGRWNAPRASSRAAGRAGGASAPPLPGLPARSRLSQAGPLHSSRRSCRSASWSLLCASHPTGVRSSGRPGSWAWFI